MSYRNGGTKEIPKFYLRYDRETKAHRGPEHYFGIIRQSTGTGKEVNSMNDSQDFCRMLNQFAVEIPTLPVDQCLSQHIRHQKGC